MSPIPATSVRIAIIGSGFGGLGMAIRLKQADIDDFVILEKAAELGGTWRDNAYPGAACDVPSHLYSYSFEPKFDWSYRFAPQAEILDYLRHCAHKYDLLPHIRFNTEVRAARFDERSQRWTIETSSGARFDAQVLVTACGQLNRPAYPDLTGLESFQGKSFHSARWDHDYDFAGKRVAVIGTGASAIQFVPRLATQAAQLTLFQRSAPYVLPKPDRPYRPWEQRLLRRFPLLHRISRAKIYSLYETRVFGFTLLTAVMRVMKWRWAHYLRRSVPDPMLRAKLVPDYPMGCKRILLANDYYPALTRPNVEVVTDAIREVRAHGIVDASGREHPVDAIVYGTGFKATEFLAPMTITGRDGRELHEAWRDGAEAYLGITVAGFPNLFLLYGPNTNLGHSSIVYMLESQIGYVMQCLATLERRRLASLEVRPEVQNRFNRWLQRQIRRSVWSQGCQSWYMTASGKQTNNWPGFTFIYRFLTRRPKLRAYRLEPPAGA